jgi:Rrf2 family protein
MKLSTKGDYATRILLELSTAEAPQPISVHELARRTAIPMRYLEQIMLRLRAGRIVRSARGVHGGYTLARPADGVTVGEVLRLMDGPLAPSPCASQSAHVACPTYRCPTEEGCTLRSLWTEVRDAIADVLDRTTFAQLAERQQRSLRREAYVI